jgi:MFS family permease
MEPFFVYLGFSFLLGFGALSAVVGSMISGKIDRRKLLLWWTTLGVVSSASVAVFSGWAFLLSSILLGISLGLGYPYFASFLADCTVIEERARISGLAILTTFLFVIFAVAVVSVFSLGLIEVVLVTILLRSTNYIALAIDPYQKVAGKEKSWREVLINRNFSFYIFPWLMFNIATGLTPFVFSGWSRRHPRRLCC